MLVIIVQALLHLCPMPRSTADTYADLIVFEARWYKIDPLLISSIINIESKWNARKRSVTNDYGLMQVHVARRGSSRFWGRERELYDPRVNIREGVRILDMWRTYHRKWCKGAHPYWAHYKWGKKVKDTLHAEKVRTLYMRLRARFRGIRHDLEV